MTPEKAQLLSDMLNSPAMAATVGLAMCALGAAALVIIKRGQKTQSDINAANRRLACATRNFKKQMAEVTEKAWGLGVENFILKMKIKARDKIIDDLQREVADLRETNEQLAQDKWTGYQRMKQQRRKAQ